MLKTYHRPQTIDEALRLLRRREVKTAVLTSFSLNDAQLDNSVDEVVDLQALKLDGITTTKDGLQLGAMTSLQTLVDAPSVPQGLRDIAKLEEPNTFRNARTLASVISNPSAESRLLAALLVYDAAVNIRTVGATRTIPLAHWLWQPYDDQPFIIVSVTLPTDGIIGQTSVARTPADQPIVAAVARKAANGQIRLALCGVANKPLLIEPSRVDKLQITGDFRGSAEYRQKMAILLTKRVLAKIGAA